jgi:DNA-binding response OmpR family regulator
MTCGIGILPDVACQFDSQCEMPPRTTRPPPKGTLALAPCKFGKCGKNHNNAVTSLFAVQALTRYASPIVENARAVPFGVGTQFRGRRQAVKLAIVENDPHILETWVDHFSTHDHEVQGFRSPGDAIQGIKQFAPALAILDVTLGADARGGFQVADELCRTLPHLPLVFVADDDNADLRAARRRYDGVAYLTKPIRLREMHERIAAILRTIELVARANVSNGDDSDDTDLTLTEGLLTLTATQSAGAPHRQDATLAAFWNNHPIELSQAHCKIIRLLVEARGRPVRYEAILEFLGSPASVTSPQPRQRNALHSAMAELRSRLDAAGCPSGVIRTHHGLGYAWARDLTR